MDKRKDDNKLEIKTDKITVGVGYGVLFLLVAVVAIIILWLFERELNPLYAGLIIAGSVVTFFITLYSALGTYGFSAANEFRGPRVFIKLGRSNYEIWDKRASDFLIKQNPLEKARNSGTIHIKGTPVKLRGVSRIDEVQNYLKQNF